MADESDELIEPVAIPDVFVSGMGRIEPLGSGILRLTFYVLADHGRQRLVVAKIIVPKEDLRENNRKIAEILAADDEGRH